MDATIKIFTNILWAILLYLERSEKNRYFSQTWFCAVFLCAYAVSIAIKNIVRDTIEKFFLYGE